MPGAASLDHNPRMARASTFGHSGFLTEAGVFAPVTRPTRTPQITAVVLWLVAGLSAGYWLMGALGRAPATALPPPPAEVAAADPAAVARALGARATPAAASDAPVAAPASRYVLLGVISTGGGGAALIAVDGKPARPFRVGATLDGGVVLQSVSARQVRLGPAGGPAAVELNLPAPPRAF